MTMFIHSLIHIRTPRSMSTLDDYGQPADGTPVETTGILGLVQPRAAREMDDHRSAGAEVADHVIFLPIGTDVDSTDAFEKDGERYEILGVRRFDFGGLAHLEVDARRVAGTEVPGAS